MVFHQLKNIILCLPTTDSSLLGARLFSADCNRSSLRKIHGLAKHLAYLRFTGGGHAGTQCRG